MDAVSETLDAEPQDPGFLCFSKKLLCVCMCVFDGEEGKAGFDYWWCPVPAGMTAPFGACGAWQAPTGEH